MPVLNIKKINVLPDGPWPPNTIYIHRGTDPDGPHIGWRVYGTAGPSGAMGFGEVGLPAGGTAFASSEFNTTNFLASNAFDTDATTSWVSVSGDYATGSYIGKVYPTSVALSSLTLTAVYTLGVQSPTSFQIQYSDDTTDGTDGTWIDHIIRMNESEWTDGEVRTFNPIPMTGRQYGTIHVSSSTGTHLYSTPSIDEITAASGGSNHGVRVANITERDELALTIDMFVKVTDATGDPDIDVGSAMYLYSHDDTTYYNLTRMCNNGGLSTADW